MMIGLKRLLTKLIAAAVFFNVFTISGSAMASNRATNLVVSKKDNQAVIAIRIEKRPGFSLKSIKGKQVLLILYDTSRSPDLDKSVLEKEAIEMVEDERTSDLTFRIRLVRSAQEIDWSWMEAEGLLLVKIALAEEKDEIESSEQGNPYLKGIRFGFKEKAARMVMNLEHRPFWEMNYHHPTSMALLLEAESKEIKQKKYGPIMWLNDVTVRKNEDKKIDVSLQLEFPLNRIRTFWMDVGNRLVVDFFDKPEKFSEGTLFSLKNMNHPTEDSLSAKEGPEKNKKQDGQFTESLTEDRKHVVRMKIPNREMTDSDSPPGLPSDSHSYVDHPLVVEPNLDTLFPFSSDISGSIEGLSPEEAFLFGRIQEAMEINDAEKGALLVNQFINRFPDSTLIEKTAFWRGDFYYLLWKKGDKEAGPKVIGSYQYAIDRFTRSEFKPLAYIKMAQVSSSAGNNFEAVAYMGILIGQKERNKYLPLAYLTRGKILLNMGQPEKAVEDFKILLGKKYRGTKISAEAHLLIAGYYHEMGLYEDAEESLRAISDANPELYLEYPEYLLLRAKNNLYLKNYDLARDFLFKAVNIGKQPEPIDMLLSRIGDTYHNQENEREAEKYYRMVIDYYPDTEGAYMAKLRLADYFSDMTILEDLSSEKSNEPIGDLAILEKAYQLFEMKKYHATMDSLLELINKPVQTETRKDAKRLYFHAAENEIEQLYAAGKYEELIELYLPNKPSMAENIHPEKLLLVAMALHNRGRHREAISALLGIKPFDLKDESRGIYSYQLASAYVGIGDNQEAIRLLEENKKQEPESHEKRRLTILLADLYLEEGQLTKAYTLYRSMIEGKNDFNEHETAKIYLSMGVILNDQEKYKEAKIILNKCLMLAHNTEQHDVIQSAYMELGKIFHAEKDYKKAVESLERGFRLGYGSDKIDYWEDRFKLAQSYVHIGRETEAEDLFNEILEEGNPTIQQRAQIKLGAMNLNRQLEQLSMGTGQRFGQGNDE